MRGNHSLDRRGFLVITGVSALAAGLSISLRRRMIRQGSLGIYGETRLLMGTPVTVQITARDQDQARRTVQRTFQTMESFVKIFDLRDPLSPLTKLNRQKELVSAPVELTSVIKEALAIGRLSHGALDIAIKPALDSYRQGFSPESSRGSTFEDIQIRGENIQLPKPGMEITLDAIAKGWIVDRTVEFLRSQGCRGTLVEAGGDLYLSGYKGGTQDWKVGIRHPRGGVAAVVQGSSQAVATSGDYQEAYDEKFCRHHVLNPKTGISPLSLASATVIAPRASQADGLSTAVLVLGAREGLDLIESLSGVEGLLVTKDLDLVSSTGFRQFLPSS